MRVTGAELRVDRFLTLNLIGPLRRISRRACADFPILMYHGITEADERAARPYYRLATPPALFAEQMGFLYDKGYSALSIGEALQRSAQRRGQADKWVVLTFDDGFRDFHQSAYPVLSRYGFTATVFLPTGYIGATAKLFKGKECLIWDEVRELHRNGILFGAHTVTHPQLRNLSRDAVEYEVRCSKETIEDKLGAPVDTFSYPYGFPEADRGFANYLRSLLAQTGCKYGVSTRIGTSSFSDDLWFLKRLPINSADDLRLFRAKLDGDYNWLHYLQYTRKLLH